MAPTGIVLECCICDAELTKRYRMVASGHILCPNCFDIFKNNIDMLKMMQPKAEELETILN